MADTYEKNLAQKPSLTTGDYIRVVGSDNVSYKQLVSDVAKKIIETYTGSSLAGKSQSVKAALDSLNSNNITSSYFSSLNGCSIVEGAVYKVGKMIVGNLVLKRSDDSAFSTTDLELTIASAYESAVVANHAAIFTSTQWAAQPYLGYFFYGKTRFIVQPMSANMKFCKVHFTYIIA